MRIPIFFIFFFFIINGYPVNAGLPSSFKKVLSRSGSNSDKENSVHESPSHHEKSITPILSSLGTPNTHGYHQILTIHLKEEGLQFATKSVEKQMKMHVSAMSVPDKEYAYAGFTLAIKNIRISDFSSPKVKIGLQPPETLKVSLEEGEFKVCIDWAVSKYGSTACVESKEKLGINVAVFVETFVEKKMLGMRITHCNVELPVKIDVKGVLGPVLKLGLVQNYVSGALEDQVRTMLCAFAKENIKTAFDRIPTHFNLTQQYGLDYELKKFDVNKDEITAQIVSEVVHLPLMGHSTSMKH